MKANLFTDTGTALITPLTSNGTFDEKAFQRQIQRQIEGGVNFIVPVGTTGQSPTVDFDEHTRVIQCAVEFADGKIPVLGGTGGNATAEAIRLTKLAAKAGVNGSLQVVPYYNKPTPEGLFQHFSAIAQAVPDLAMILYNVPGRTGVDMGVDVVERIVNANENVVGIKEASGSSDRVSQLRAALGPDFNILSGDDSLTLPFMAVGAQGVISVASNVIPKEVSEMVRQASEGCFLAAREMHARLFRLFKVLFVETNPQPVTYAMYCLGLDGGTMRLPMVSVTDSSKKLIRQTLKDLGLEVVCE